MVLCQKYLMNLDRPMKAIRADFAFAHVGSGKELKINPRAVCIPTEGPQCSAFFASSIEYL